MNSVSRQAGQATVEYLYVLPIMLLLMLASLQFVFIYEAKQTLNYATFVGTRAGALNNGDMKAIQDSLAAGFAPLFAHGADQQALKDARAAAKAEIGNTKLTLIQIVSPTSGALSGISSATGGSDIPNDNLMYRDPTALYDGMNIQDANLLKVRVTYCVRLVVPLVNRLVHSFLPASGDWTPTGRMDTYSGGTISAADMLKVESTGSACSNPGDAYPYRIPVTSEAVVRMQSPFKDPGSWTGPIP